MPNSIAKLLEMLLFCPSCFSSIKAYNSTLFTQNVFLICLWHNVATQASTL
jgi:hypothetical protein